MSDLLAALEAVEIVRPEPESMCKAALWYVEKLHWPVFPLHWPVNGDSGLVCSCGRDCASPAKHPRTANGFKDASVDPEQVRQWWERWPLANVGTPTGGEGNACGFDVIDIDGPEGIETFRAWHDGAPETVPPLAALAFTPGNRKRKAGRHYLTPARGTTNTTRALPGIDLRGLGGYILLPPSRGITGARYQWIEWPEAP